MNKEETLEEEKKEEEINVLLIRLTFSAYVLYNKSAVLLIWMKHLIKSLLQWGIL